MIHIPGWLVMSVVVALALAILWQHTTHSEFLWFLAGVLSCFIGICVWAVWLEQRKKQKKAKAAK